ncbi:hypothetical protein [Cetobacterium sp.]|uniref:hypothetical protein n=1 Tax=Cetobacterium sp. TaxID=2071632 RepID=UPI003F30B4E5
MKIKCKIDACFLTKGKVYESAKNLGEEVNFYVLLDDRNKLIQCYKHNFEEMKEVDTNDN